MSGKKKFILGLIVAVILVAASVAVVVIIQMQQKESSAEEYQAAQDYLDAEEPVKALGPLHRAAIAAEEDDPGKELQYRLEAARLALELRRGSIVEVHAKRLWDDLGLRDEEILWMLLSVSNKPMEENLKYGLELVSQMEDSPAKTEAKAKVFIRYDEIEKARDILEKLYKENPSQGVVESLCQVYLKLNEGPKAVELLESNRKSGLLGAYGYQTLTGIRALQDKFEEANTIYEEARKNNKYTDTLQIQQAITYFSYAKFKKCAELLEGIIFPYRLGTLNQETKSFIIPRKFKDFVNLFKAGTDPFVAALLPQLHPNTRALLAEFDPEKSSEGPLYTALVIDFNRILGGASLYNEKLFPDRDKLSERTRELLAVTSPSPDELFELNRCLLTDGFKKYLIPPEPNYLSSRARVFLATLVEERPKPAPAGATAAEPGAAAAKPATPEEVKKGIEKEKAAMLARRLARIDRLEKMARGTRRWLEGERIFYKYFRKRLNNEEGAFATLQKAYQLLDTYPTVIVQMAREYTVEKKYADAISTYEKLMTTDRIFARSYLIQFEMALALARDEKYKRALAVIAQLHKRKYITKATLEVYRDLSEKLKIKSASSLAQNLLEKIYKNDPKIEYQGAMMSLRAGDYQKAFENFDKLFKKYPDNQEIEYIRLAALLGTGDYNRVLAECDQSKLSEVRLASIRADALENLKRNNEALAAYKKAAESPDFPLFFRIRYGRMLLANGKTDEGLAQFKEVLAKDPKNTLANLGMATVAWQKKDYKKARKYINVAKDNSPEDMVEIYQLLADVDYAENKIDSAYANVLQARKIDPRNPRNLYLLGKIQIQRGELEEAKRNLSAYLQEVPKDVDAQFQLVKALGALKEYDRALMLIANLIETNPQSVQLRRIRLDLLLGAKRVEDAQKVLNLIKSSISAVEALRYEARLREVAGDLPGAIALLRTRIIDPDIALYWATLKLKQKSPEGILTVIQKHNYTPMALGRLAMTADLGGNIDLSSDLYALALEKEPENIMWLNNFAWANLRSSKPDQKKIMAAIKKADKLSPGNISIIDTYAAVLNTFKQSAEAIKLLTDNINLTLSSKRLVYYLAAAYDAQHETQKALEYYKRAREMKTELTDPAMTNAALDARIAELKAKLAEPQNKGE